MMNLLTNTTMNYILIMNEIDCYLKKCQRIIGYPSILQWAGSRLRVSNIVCQKVYLPSRIIGAGILLPDTSSLQDLTIHRSENGVGSTGVDEHVTLYEITYIAEISVRRKEGKEAVRIITPASWAACNIHHPVLSEIIYGNLHSQMGTHDSFCSRGSKAASCLPVATIETIPVVTGRHETMDPEKFIFIYDEVVHVAAYARGRTGC